MQMRQFILVKWVKLSLNGPELNQSYLGRLPERIFQAYSLRNFWKMVVRAIMGSPVLSWEHCTMHFL